MEFDLIGDTGDSVGSISNSNFFGGQVKSREHYSLPTLHFIFHLSMLVAFVVMGVVHVVCLSSMMYFSVRSTLISAEVALLRCIEVWDRY